MIITSYCEHCGQELSSLFCEHCGTISTNIPNSLSNDDSLAGLLANIINQGNSLSFTQITSLTNSSERAYRIFSQLEKTKNFIILKQANEFLITTDSKNLSQTSNFMSFDTEITIYLLRTLLELFSLDLEEINTFFNSNYTSKELKKALGKRYEINTISEKVAFLKHKTS